MKSPIHEIDNALSGSSPGQLFRVPPFLVDEFANHDCETERTRIKHALMIAVAVLFSQLGINWLIIPDIVKLDAFVRLVFAVPLGMLSIVLVAGYTKTTLQHKIAGSVFGVLCSILCSFILIFSDAPGAPIYLTANSVILAFVITVMRPPIGVSILVAVLIGVIEMLAAYFAPWFTPATFVAIVGVTGAVVIPLLYANWCLDNELRRKFLEQKRDEIRLKTIADQRDMLARLAAIDELTGLPNRRGFEAGVTSDIEHAAAGACIAVAMIDIDHFKSFNDCYGHPAGDDALRQVASAIEDTGIQGARVGRIGGEEFVMAIIGIDAGALEWVGSRLCTAVERLQIPHHAGGARQYVSISVGIAWERTASLDIAPLLSLADTLLYEAKSRGRNRAVFGLRDEDDTAPEVFPGRMGSHRNAPATVQG